MTSCIHIYIYIQSEHFCSMLCLWDLHKVAFRSLDAHFPCWTVLRCMDISVLLIQLILWFYCSWKQCPPFFMYPSTKIFLDYIYIYIYAYVYNCCIKRIHVFILQVSKHSSPELYPWAKPLAMPEFPLLHIMASIRNFSF